VLEYTGHPLLQWHGLCIQGNEQKQDIRFLLLSN